MAFIYLSSIILANLLVQKYGIVSFLGLSFPAGAVVVGITFTLRDTVQIKYGKWGCWAWMILASLITLCFSSGIAVASMTAFVLSESIDWIVFTLYPGSIRKRMVISNLVGIPSDSLIFVTMLFGWNPAAIAGQAVVKIVSSLVVVFFLVRK